MPATSRLVLVSAMLVTLLFASLAEAAVIADFEESAATVQGRVTTTLPATGFSSFSRSAQSQNGPSAPGGQSLQLRPFADSSTSNGAVASARYDLGLQPGEYYDLTTATSASIDKHRLYNDSDAGTLDLSINLIDTDGDAHLVASGIQQAFPRFDWGVINFSNFLIPDVVALEVVFQRGGSAANGDDYQLRLDNFQAPGATLVPEPGTIALPAIGTLMMLARRRLA